MRKARSTPFQPAPMAATARRSSPTHRTGANWYDASAICAGNSNSRLCSPDEWLHACTLGVLTDKNWGSSLTNWWEFTNQVSATSQGVVAVVSTNGKCNQVEGDTVTNNNANRGYRCCKDKGISINVGSGAVWKSVSLSNTASWNVNCAYQIVKSDGPTRYYATFVNSNQIDDEGSALAVNSNAKSTSTQGSAISAIYESCPAGVTGIGA